MSGFSGPKSVMKTLCVTVSTPTRLDRAVQALTGLSRARVRGLLDHECVLVNNAQACAGQMVLNAGDRVEVRYDPDTHYREQPKVKEDPAFRVLFEDEHVIVVNKAAHVLTVPTPGGKGKTLIDALRRTVNRGRQPIKGRQQRGLHVVHRLDLGVSGVLVIAKTAGAAEKIRQQFAARKPDRGYIAIVNGIVETKRGTFSSHLATDGALNRYSTKKPGKGQLAVTHYEVLSTARGASVVRVRLETGRRNQIRVHFAEAGHPVLGDPRYPCAANAGRAAVSATSLHPRWKARRIALHAHTLEFVHPETGKLLRFEAELPAEFLPFVRGRNTP